MNRRLHNSFLALSASGAMLVLAAMAGSPSGALAPAVADTVTAGVPAPDRDDATADADAGIPVLEAVDRAIDASRPGRNGAHRSRRAVLVPYFSFARG
ncbi:hypothetical protein GCM10028862_15960 [Luteimonas pelagia]